MGTPTPLNRRHVLLLVAALAVPSVVLVVLGVRVVGDERELAAARLANEPRRIVSQISTELATRLERIALDEAVSLSTRRAFDAPQRPRHADAPIVGWIRDGGFRLPWDDDPNVAQASESLRRVPYADVIADGERLEFTTEQLPLAAAAYARARVFARTPFEADYADLLRARALTKDPCQCGADAREVYDRLLSSDAVDDQGMPLALYAATALIQAPETHARVLDLIERRLARQEWTNPAAAFRERDLLSTIEKISPEEAQRTRARALVPGLERRLAELDAAIALNRAFPTSLPAGSAGRVWRLFGSRPWMVSEGPALPGLPPFALAVPAAPLFAALERNPSLVDAASGPLRFATSGSVGLPMDDRFPGLRVAFPAADEAAMMNRATRKQTFDILALVSVLGVTVLAGTP